MNYPQPQDNHYCRCAPNLMAAFFCATGHMLECHWPYTCDQAGCSHLYKYDWSLSDIQIAEELAKEVVLNGPFYLLNSDGSIKAVPKVEMFKKVAQGIINDEGFDHLERFLIEAGFSRIVRSDDTIVFTHQDDPDAVITVRIEEVSGHVY